MTASGTTGRVLVIGDDMRIFLSVVRAFGRAGRVVEVFPFDSSAPALRSKFIAKIHPGPEYAADPGSWKESLVALLRGVSFDLVVPCTDPAIITLADSRGILAGQNLAIPNEQAILELFDKENTHKLCEKLGIPVCPSARLAANDTVDSLMRGFDLPLVIKPRRSYRSDRREAFEKVEIIENRDQLAKFLAGLQDRSHYLVESYFKGVGVGVSVLSSNGKILQAFQHRRLREGHGGCSSYRISEPVDAALRQACEQICRHTSHTGVCMFEFRRNPASGKWILLETNARFWGSLPLPLSLGLDYPNLLYDLLVRQVGSSEQSYSAGVRSRNFMLDGLNLCKQLRRLEVSKFATWIADVGDFALQPIRWVSGAERSDSFVYDDLGPALWEFLALLRRPRKIISGKVFQTIGQSPGLTGRP